MQKRDKGLQNYAHISLKNVCLTTIVPFRFLSLFMCVCLWKLHIIFCAPFARVSNNVFEWSYFIVECFIVAVYYVQRKKNDTSDDFFDHPPFSFSSKKTDNHYMDTKKREFRYAFYVFLFLLFYGFFLFTFLLEFQWKSFFLCKLFWILLLWNLLMIISFSFAWISLNFDRLYTKDRE